MYQQDLSQSDQLSTLNHTVQDKRRKEFALIDYLFIDAGFDIYTQALYLKIVRRGDNDEDGFFETRSNTANFMGVSIEKIRQCRDFLAFCNIIKIYNRKNTIDSSDTTPLIQLIDKKYWNLKHEYRDAAKFSKALKEKKIIKPAYGLQYIEFYEENKKNKLRVIKTIEAQELSKPVATPYAIGVTPPPYHQVGTPPYHQVGTPPTIWW